MYSANGTGSCPLDEVGESSTQYQTRIPLPHMGRRYLILLCAVSPEGAATRKGGIFVQRTVLTAYSTPFSKAYWRTAAADLKNPRVLCFAALMIAACVALSYVPSIPVGDTGSRVTWGFLARSVCGMAGGPLTALVFGVAEDTVSFFINPSGAYFPGYALTTALGTMLYALFLYRARPTPGRVLLAKLTTNLLNVLLGSVWSAILSGKGYGYYVTIRFWKNLLTLPIQTLLLFLVLNALYPILCEMGLAVKIKKGDE